MKNLLAFQSEPVPTAVTRGRFVATAADAAAEYVGEGPKRGEEKELIMIRLGLLLFCCKVLGNNLNISTFPHIQFGFRI